MHIRRLNGGQPLIASTENSWETSGTSNSGAVWVPPTQEMLGIVSKALGVDITQDAAFAEGLVICLYSANGTMPGDPVSRQRRGLAVLSPALEVKYRRSLPVLSPDVSEDSVDLLGIEDARVTYADGVFYLWYCGYNGVEGYACCAASRDLLHWEKQLPMPGDINRTGNKDHVIFPESIGGKWWLLHRPWGRQVPNADDYAIRLASAPTPQGPWTDEGELLRGLKKPEHSLAWVGGGAPPLPLGDGRYLLLYHNGCFFHDGYRQYDACACVVNFAKYTPGQVSSMVSHRTEPFMAPETEAERNADLRIDIIFPMSLHEYRGELYFLYGAGDKATCGAKVSFAEALAEMGWKHAE